MKRGLRLHHSRLANPWGRPSGLARSPLALRRLVLLPTIYFIDFKVVLGRFIRRWSWEVMWIDDVAISLLLLDLSLYKDAQTPSKRPSLIQIKTQHRRIRARLSNVVD
jgi:hypothetical protein